MIRMFVNLQYFTFILTSIVSCFSQNFIFIGFSFGSLAHNFAFDFYQRWLPQKTVIIIYNLLVIISPELIFCGLYFIDFNIPFAVNLIVWLLIQQQTLIMTSNIPLAILQFLNTFVIVYVIIYYMCGFQSYSLIWIPLCYFQLYKYYEKKISERLLFQESQVNQSIYKMVEETTPEQMICFTFNREAFKYEILFTNMKELNLNRYLGDTIINHESLKSHLFKKINLDPLPIQASKEIINCKLGDKKFIIDLYIQYYPKLKFFLKQMEPQTVKNYKVDKETKMIYSFHKKIIQKIATHPYQNTFIQLQKNFYSLNACIQLSRILENPQKYQIERTNTNIRHILDELCKSLSLKTQIDGIQEIEINRIVFATLFYYLLRIIRAKNKYIYIIIFKQGELRIQINLKFSYPINSRFLKDKIYFINDINSLSRILSENPIEITKNIYKIWIDIDRDVAFR